MPRSFLDVESLIYRPIQVDHEGNLIFTYQGGLNPYRRNLLRRYRASAGFVCLQGSLAQRKCFFFDNFEGRKIALSARKWPNIVDDTAKTTGSDWVLYWLRYLPPHPSTHREPEAAW